MLYLREAEMFRVGMMVGVRGGEVSAGAGAVAASPLGRVADESLGHEEAPAGIRGAARHVTGRPPGDDGGPAEHITQSKTAR